MLEMIEVIGISAHGFSEAVQNAIEHVNATGRKIHFFEVVEQRGAVREGLLKEFQIKLKIALEMNVAPLGEKKEKFCPTCQKPHGAAGHLCVPKTKKDTTCDWCGALIADERHLCNKKIKELAYICNTCGRTAVSAEYLCSPKKIK